MLDFQASTGEAAFDAGTGLLAELYRTAMRGPEAPVGLARAERLARVWLAEQGLPVDDWNLDTASVEGARQGRISYRFAWNLIGVDGVLMPALIRVKLSASGQVVVLTHINQPLEVPVKPRITEAEAIRLALEQAGQPADAVRRTRLHVWFDDDGGQRLRWRVEFADAEEPSAVTLDAQTGEVVREVAADVAKTARPSSRKPPLAPLLALAGVVIAAAGTLALRLRRRG